MKHSVLIVGLMCAANMAAEPTAPVADLVNPTTPVMGTRAPAKVAKLGGNTLLAMRSAARRWQLVLESIVTFAREHKLLSASIESLYNAIKDGGAYPKLDDVKIALEHINQIFVAAKINVRPLSVIFDAHVKRLQARGLTDEKDISVRALRSTLSRVPMLQAKITRAPRPDASPAAYPPWGGQDSASLKNLAVSVGTALNGATAVAGTFNVNGYSFPAQDGAASTMLTTDGAGHLSFSVGAGAGDVVGPTSALNRAIVLFNGTSGKVIKNSSAAIMDDGTVFVDKLSVAGAGTSNALNVNGAASVGALTVQGVTHINGATGEGETIIGNETDTLSLNGFSIGVNGRTNINLGNGGTTQISDGMAGREVGVGAAAVTGNVLTVTGKTAINTEMSNGETSIGNDSDELTLKGSLVTIDGAGEWGFLGDYAPYVSINDTVGEAGAQLGCDDGIIGANVQALPGHLNLNTYDLAEGATTQIGNYAIGSTVGIGGPADPGRSNGRVPGFYELKVTGDTWLTGNLQVDGISSMMPAGSMVLFVTGVPPTGFLSCDGASYATAEYSNLFDAIGYTFGGSGANFNVPSATPGFAHGQYVIKS